MIRDDIKERFRLTMTLPLPPGNEPSATFSVCWITYEKFPTTYIPGDLESISVLKIMLLC